MMYKLKQSYSIKWLISFVLFQLICFVTPDTWYGYDKFGGAFWAAYLLIDLAYIINLIISIKALDEENAEKLFLNLSLIKIANAALVVETIVGIACMVIPDLPNWVCEVIEFIVIALYLISVTKAQAAITVATEVHDNTKASVALMKELTAQSAMLASSATKKEIKDAVEAVAEALRYSDPKSSNELAEIEQKMKDEFDALKETVNKDSDDAIKLAEELMALIAKRNELCKLYK